MIRSEFLEEGKRIKHWSDINNYILQVETGNIYIDAVDVVPCKYTYVETDEHIPDEPIEEVNESKEEI